MRKPNCTSVLKNLKPEEQRELFEYSEGTSTSRRHTRVATIAWIKERFKVDTCPQSLRAFVHWWPTAQRMSDAAAHADYVKAVLKWLPGVDIDDDLLLRIGQAFFEAEAKGELKKNVFAIFYRLRQKDRALDLQESAMFSKEAFDERRVACSEKKLELTADRLMEMLLDGKFQTKVEEIKGVTEWSNAEKIAALRQAAFAEIYELQASGKVVIPL